MQCFCPGLVTIQRGICKSPKEFDRQNPVSGLWTTCPVGSDCPSVSVSTLVPTTSGNGNGVTSLPTKQKEPNPTNTQCQPSGHEPTTSRVGYLREKFRGQKILEYASRLLLSHWIPESSKTYDSLFTKWVSWCSERSSVPILRYIGDVVNFVAYLFHQGYQYRSLNSYRSAISFVHEKVDGYDVGQHPLVTRDIKEAFHERPPQPRHSETWDVSTVISYIETMGGNDKLSFQDLSYKVVMLLVLTRPSR